VIRARDDAHAVQLIIIPILVWVPACSEEILERGEKTYLQLEAGNSFCK
jgi:hypothetical protein